MNRPFNFSAGPAAIDAALPACGQQSGMPILSTLQVTALASGRVNSDALITSVIGLDQVDAKLHELASGTSPDVKVLVQPGLLES